MRRLLMSRLIKIVTVCLVNLFFIPIINKIAVRIYLLSEVTRYYPNKDAYKTVGTGRVIRSYQSGPGITMPP